MFATSAAPSLFPVPSSAAYVGWVKAAEIAEATASKENKKPADRAFVKKGMTQEDARRRREETTVVLRKTKRDDAVMQKRRLGTQGQLAKTQEKTPPITPTITTTGIGLFNQKTQGCSSELQNMPAWMEALNADQATHHKLQAVTAIRKLLSITDEPPTQEIIDYGVVPKMVALLTPENPPQLQVCLGSLSLSLSLSISSVHVRVRVCFV
jgi:importin subunit alpha-1